MNRLGDNTLSQCHHQHQYIQLELSGNQPLKKNLTALPIKRSYNLVHARETSRGSMQRVCQLLDHINE